MAAPSTSPTSAARLELELGSAAATGRLGQRLGRLMQAGDIIGLDGPLGAGKTCLVTGLARGLGATEPVASPTFTLINQHAVPPDARRPAGLTLYHIDLYRLNAAAELDELGLWEMAESGGVMAVEWLSRFPGALPSDRLNVTLALGPGRGRTASISAGGPRAQGRIDELAKALQRR